MARYLSLANSAALCSLQARLGKPHRAWIKTHTPALSVLVRKANTAVSTWQSKFVRAAGVVTPRTRFHVLLLFGGQIDVLPRWPYGLPLAVVIGDPLL